MNITFLLLYDSIKLFSTSPFFFRRNNKLRGQFSLLKDGHFQTFYHIYGISVLPLTVLVCVCVCVCVCLFFWVLILMPQSLLRIFGVPENPSQALTNNPEIVGVPVLPQRSLWSSVLSQVVHPVVVQDLPEPGHQAGPHLSPGLGVHQRYEHVATHALSIRSNNTLTAG